MKKYDVGVLIPAYNNLQGLLLSIKSVQDEKVSFIFIIIDDGSKNPVTEEALRNELANDDFIILRNEPNQGIEYSLHRGVNEAKKLRLAYLARLDCDDLCKPGRLTKQYEFLKNNPFYAMTTSYVEIVDEYNRFIKIEKPLINKLKKLNTITHSSVMFNVDKVLAAGNYNISAKKIEDYDLWMRLYQKYGEFGVIQEVLVSYVISQTVGLTAQNLGVMRKARLKVQLKYFDFLSLDAYVGVIRTLFSFLLPRKI